MLIEPCSGVKSPHREADHTALSRAEVKNAYEAQGKLSHLRLPDKIKSRCRVNEMIKQSTVGRNVSPRELICWMSFDVEFRIDIGDIHIDIESLYRFRAF